MSNAILGRFIWHELLTPDTSAAEAFYPKVLPWRSAPSSMPGYTIWMAGQTQVGGLMQLPAEGNAPPHWLIYIGTPNVDSTCTQAQALGARVCKAPSDIPNVGRFAVLADPQGATFAVFTPGGNPPPPVQPEQGGFSWHELATTDAPAALRFYGELCGWQKGPSHDMGGAMGAYQVIRHENKEVAGMYNVQGASTPPHWLSYVHVTDCNRAVAAAKAAGGRVLHGPMEVPGGSWVGMLMDPLGGAFAVHEPPGSRATQAKPAAADKPAAAKPTATAKAAAPAKPATPAKPLTRPAGAPAAKAGAAKAPAGAAPQKAAKKAIRKAAKKPAARPAAKAKKKAVKAKRGARKAPKKAAARRSAKKSAGKLARRASPRRHR